MIDNISVFCGILKPTYLKYRRHTSSSSSPSPFSFFLSPFLPFLSFLSPFSFKKDSQLPYRLLWLKNHPQSDRYSSGRCSRPVPLMGIPHFHGCAEMQSHHSIPAQNPSLSFQRHPETPRPASHISPHPILPIRLGRSCQGPHAPYPEMYKFRSEIGHWCTTPRAHRTSP